MVGLGLVPLGADPVSPRQFSTGPGLGRAGDVAAEPPHDATV